MIRHGKFTDTIQPELQSGKMTNPASISVFCGSRFGDRPEYANLAARLGEKMARSGIRLVYGGGDVGLMGACARATRDAGGDVLGIIPGFLQAREIPFEGGQLEVVDTLHERKARMAQECDGFIVLPGGLGTLEEVVEVLSWVNLEELQQPVIFLDEDGYWDPFFDLIEHTISRGFTAEIVREQAQRAHEVDTAIAMATARLGSSVPGKSQ